MQTTTDFPSETRVENPEKRKLTPLVDNAYRVLGLSCHASEKEINAAAASIRRAIKLGVERPSAHRLAWLGHCERTENAVRDALSRLAVPAQRIDERFFWFFEPETIVPESGFDALAESLAKFKISAGPSAAHDAALLALAVMLRLDPELQRADDWRRTFSLWREVIEEKAFWSLMMAADLKGDFEQVTTFEEIRRLRGRAWRLVASPVAEVAKDAILREEHALARRALDLLRRGGLPQSLADEYESEILGPVEDEFDAIFAEAFRAYRYEVKTYQSVGERRATCARALAKFDSEVRPALKKILELAGIESLFARRAFEAAADGLDELAGGFETVQEYGSRLRLLRRAWLFAPPESVALMLIEEHLAAAGDKKARQPKTEAAYERQLKHALREPAPRPQLFTAYIQKEESVSTFERYTRMLAKGALGFLLAVAVAKCFGSLPGSPNANALRPMNFNIAVPAFTPPDLSELRVTPLVERVTARELQTKLRLKTAVAVDVSAKNEYDARHIAGALSFPLPEIAARSGRLPRSKQIVLYCDSDEQRASIQAAVELLARGFVNVAVLEGGYQAWLEARLPVISRKANDASGDRPVVYGTRDSQ